MTTEAAHIEPQQKLCKGPLHREGKMLPITSFSARASQCRACVRDYDQRRGSSRGEPRSVTRERKKESTNMAKQTELHIVGKGVERVSIAEVDALVDKYVAARDARMAKTEKEVEAKTNLIASLRKHADKIGVKKENDEEVIVYRHDDLIVTLKHGKDDLKVKTEEPDEE